MRRSFDGSSLCWQPGDTTNGDRPRAGDWMQTYTGRQFWPLDPRPDEVCIEDIAHALSQLCRYAGHCLSFYSVAQHSVLISLHCRPEHALWGLLHDAAEAYICDLPRPVKRSIQQYKEIERDVERAVAERFGLPWPMPPEVKDIDNRILFDEREQLMAPPPRPWRLYGPPLGIAIEPMPPTAAKAAFLDRYHSLLTREDEPA